MTISQTDRKLLWARAHNRCAICRASLTRPADDATRPGLVLGEEAHIVARSEGGPRGGERAGIEIDGYSNLILLCADDHKRIDDQPAAFSAEYLRTLKADHERWAESQHDAPQFTPLKVLAGPDEDAILFQPLMSGRQVWELLAGAQAWGLFPLDESHSEDDVDAADQFLTIAQDWASIAVEVELDGPRAVRSAQRSLSEALNELWSREIYVWGRRLPRTMTGGVGAPAPWLLAQLATRTLQDLDAQDDPHWTPNQDDGDPPTT